MIGGRVVGPARAGRTAQRRGGVDRELVPGDPPQRQTPVVQTRGHAHQMAQGDPGAGVVPPHRNEVGCRLIQTRERAGLLGHGDQDREQALGHRSDLARAVGPPAGRIAFRHDLTLSAHQHAGAVVGHGEIEDRRQVGGRPGRRRRGRAAGGEGRGRAEDGPSGQGRARPRPVHRTPAIDRAPALATSRSAWVKPYSGTTAPV